MAKLCHEHNRLETVQSQSILRLLTIRRPFWNWSDLLLVLFFSSALTPCWFAPSEGFLFCLKSRFARTRHVLVPSSYLPGFFKKGWALEPPAVIKSINLGPQTANRIDLSKKCVFVYQCPIFYFHCDATGHLPVLTWFIDFLLSVQSWSTNFATYHHMSRRREKTTCCWMLVGAKSGRKTYSLSIIL